MFQCGMDGIAASLINTGYLIGAAVLSLREVRRKRVGFFLLYMIGVACVATAFDLTDRLGGSSFLSRLLTASAPLAALGFTLVLSLYLVAVLGILYRGKDTEVENGSPLLGLAGWYLLSLALSYTYVFQALGLRDMVAGVVTHRFSDALYFVAITFTTVGYGDLVPSTQLGRLFAALAALNSYVVLALFLSAVVPRFLVSRLKFFDSKRALH